MKFRLLAAIAGLLLLVMDGQAIRAQSVGLVQNGETCFQIATGPVSSGSVNMYYPNTTNYKPTYQNSLQTVLNSTPLQLDSNGCGIIWGSGSYRQQLYTGPVVGGQPTGNLVFDLTTTVNTNNVFWAGLAGGTPNVIAVIDPGFSAVDGTVINFLAIATNTSSVTLNPSGYGAYPIEKATTGGLVALTGGEIIQNNPVSVVFSAVNSAFLLLNPPIQTPSGSSAPLCGAVGYTASNASGSPTTQMAIQATTAVTVSGTGQSLNRGNISLTLNFAINGANGLDQNSIVAGDTYYIYLIDNGAAIASLASLSSTNPLMPSGYTYSCRLSAVQFDSSSNLRTFITQGRDTMVTNTSYGSNAIAGTCFTNYVSLNIAVPATAVEVSGYLTVSGAHNISVVASLAGGSVGGQWSPGVAGLGGSSFFKLPLTTPQTLYYCNDSASNQLVVNAWTDATNAN